MAGKSATRAPRCQALTLRGGKCRNGAWKHWPMCKEHIRIASAEFVEDKYGINARHWVIIDNTQEDDEYIEGYE